MAKLLNFRSRRMTTLRRVVSVVLVALGLAGLAAGSFAQEDEAAADPLAELMGRSDRAVVLELTGPIGPALSHYIVEGIEDAQGNASAIILEMDTPGGLDTSMREIIQAILASEVPVFTYVSPSGARAASAGAFILYASHVAAMSPGTAVGAATPIQMGGESPIPSSPDDGGDEETAEPDPVPEGASATAPRTPLDAKAMNDALALARSLAELRGRNMEFAEAMIRDASSVNSSEALEMGIIEFVVRNPAELLEAANGMVVDLDGEEVELATSGLALERVPMTWVQNLISLLTNPNVAFILMNFGMLGILIEFYNPGSILPGVAGVICLVLALYALSVLPFSATGLALLVIGLLLMGAELFVTSGGILAVGGFIAFGIGAFFLFDAPVAEFRLDIRVLIATLALFGAVIFTIIAMALRAFARKVQSGPELLIGMKGHVVEWSGDRGIVFLDGEAWQSRSSDTLEPGQTIIATDREGNHLVVQSA